MKTVKGPKVEAVPTIWVMTFTANDYDQHGDYFVKAFKEKPDMAKAATALSESGVVGKDFMSAIAICQKFLDGGAVGDDHFSYSLSEVPLL